jgi:hypothetical protein
MNWASSEASLPSSRDCRDDLLGPVVFYVVSSIRDLAESLVLVNGDDKRAELGELQTSSSP